MAPIARIGVAVALLMVAAVALRGYLPGAPPPEGPAVSSALAVALMPVLMLVSIVVLLAGVLASRHRLPLAMPPVDRSASEPLRLPRPAYLLPIVVGLLVLIVSAGITAMFMLPGARTEKPPVADPSDSGSISPTRGPTPDPNGPTEIVGTTMVVVAAGAVVLIAIALVGVLVVAAAARKSPVAEPPPDIEQVAAEVDSLTRAAEMGLAAMNAPGQDPRTAIIATYLAMERGLSGDRAAAPHVSDTPMEVLARAFEAGALHDGSARELVALFEEARFSPHSMLEWQRMRADQLLRVVLADLQRRVADR